MSKVDESPETRQGRDPSTLITRLYQEFDRLVASGSEPRAAWLCVEAAETIANLRADKNGR